MRKDAKYEEHVKEHGGRFVTLVVESLGLWSPFATSTLKAIAERTTAKNSLGNKAALSNLNMEQLSIKLWMFNADDSQLSISAFLIGPIVGASSLRPCFHCINYYEILLKKN